MNRAHWHQFQILTKRSERLLELSPRLKWAPNIWQGVSVESADYRYAPTFAEPAVPLVLFGLTSQPASCSSGSGSIRPSL